MNRFVWNMRYPAAHRVAHDKTTEDQLDGPLARPGTYKVKLTVNDHSEVQNFKIVKDPRVAATQAVFQAQFDLLINLKHLHNHCILW